MNKSNTQNHTIAAIATPAGEGGIAIIRISGTHAVSIANQILTYRGKLTNRMAKLARLDTGAVKDEVIVLFFQAPHSYTGEDIIEIQCHGSYFLAGRIVEACIEHGCKPAEPGEFTRRAFLNGRLDLTQAEGILDLIGAQSDASAKAAYDALKGGVFDAVSLREKELVQLIANASVAVDYPEEDLAEPVKEELLIGIKRLVENLNVLKETYRDGVLFRDGVRTAIAGEPNVGKSSLLNRLLGRDRAIVTEHAGTTRDTVEESFLYRGIRFVLIDTAGLREATDEAERLGIERSRRAVEHADLILAVSEVQKPFTQALPDGVPVLFVKNKTDLMRADPEKNAGTVFISARTGDNITGLKEAMYQKTAGKISGSGIKLNNMRHLSAVNRAIESLIRAQNSAALNIDCMLSDLNEALRALGSITGTKASDEVINEIFARFCVGK